MNVFLDGAGADQAEKSTADDSKPDATAVSAVAQPKEQKAFRLPVDLIIE